MPTGRVAGAPRKGKAMGSEGHGKRVDKSAKGGKGRSDKPAEKRKPAKKAPVPEVEDNRGVGLSGG